MIPFIVKKTLEDVVTGKANLNSDELISEMQEDNPHLVNYIVKMSSCPEIKSSHDFLAGALMMYEVIREQIVQDAKYEE